MTAQFFLEGVIFSLEQCGVHLRDAVTLFEKGGYSNAIVLATYAIEEIGRSESCRDLRKKVLRGETVSPGDYSRECENHIEKQKRGLISTTQQVSGEEGLAKLLRIRMKSHPQSEEYKEADRELENITERQRKHTPESRHQMRVRSLYVEPNESFTGWDRPATFRSTISAPRTRWNLMF